MIAALLALLATLSSTHHAPTITAHGCGTHWTVQGKHFLPPPADTHGDPGAYRNWYVITPDDGPSVSDGDFGTRFTVRLHRPPGTEVHVQVGRGSGHPLERDYVIPAC